MKPVVTRLLFVAAVASLSAGVLAPAAVQAQPSVTVQIGPPPPPRFERVPPPRAGYFWAPGHWEWRHGRHVWMGGEWMRARPGYVYRAPQYVERGGRWGYDRGRWDRDGDGVPDRYDSRPNNPYRR